MRARGAAVLAACWTLPFLLLSQVDSSGVFQLQLQSFINDKGLNIDGNCCNGIRVDGTCSARCHTFFRICLSHYQAAIATDPDPHCTFGEYKTLVVAENSVNFSLRTDLPMDNPILFPISQFSWPGDFSLIIEAFHDTTLVGPTEDSARELITRLAVQRSAAAGADWYNSKYSTRYTELSYSYRFICDTNYYGPTCTDLCRPRDDQFGHYYCSENGTNLCMDGWQGEYCDRAICLAGCHPDNGFCDKPNECRCRLGWEGKHCNVCIPYPGCQHGTCITKPYWECTCEEGWGGLFCNQDLNFCTHHAPCKNGGTCTNTGQGSYSCACRPGYSGSDCEVRIDHCKDQPCLNGAVCEDTGTGFQCHCLQGFYGQFCEQEANYCRAETCFNGGTCVDFAEGSYQCRCAQGYEGFHCETDTGGCKKDTCKSGGRCVNGECICPLGLSGPTCDDTIDDCAHKPCLNGGTCRDLTNDFECRCMAGYIGTLCDINVDECEMRPCANGGSCTDLVNDFVCTCAPGFTGKDCSLNMDECRDQPCQHGGTCMDRVNDYTCLCLPGFWGKDCHLYQGMSTVTTPPPIKTPSPTSRTTTKAPITLPEQQLPLGNTSSQGARLSNEEEVGLTSQQLLIVVCVGAGLPLLLIIVVVVILLFHKRRHLRQNQDNMDREQHQNYINNMNNRESEPKDKHKHVDDGGGGGGGVSSNGRTDGKIEGGAGIFTTTYPHAAALPSTSGVKISNEEQQDINWLNAQQHRAARDKAAGKSFIRDSMVHDAPHASSGQRDSRYEKAIRRLDVDSLSEDTRANIGSYHPYSAPEVLKLVQPMPSPTALHTDPVRTSVYLQPAHSHYAEDYIATEV